METFIARSRFVEFLDATSQGARPYLLLLVLCLALFIPGISSFPVMDRDEPRYAQATKQMLETGDYIAIRNQEKFRNKKPVGIYWLQAAAVQAVGKEFKDVIWPYRLPSLIGATLSVLLCFRIGSLLTERRVALLGALLLLCSPLMQALAHLATTDTVLLCIILLAQACMFAVFTRLEKQRRPSLLAALGFWAALGVGILVKGPVILAVCGSTGLLLWIRSNEKWETVAAFHPWFGLPILLAIVLPWFLAIEKVTEGAFIEESLGKDFLGKLFSGQESHGAPPGFYLLLLPLTFWPAAFAMIPALRRAWDSRKFDWFSTACIYWIGPYWAMIELAPTKLVHYMMPLYPALALVTARELLSEEAWELSRKWLRGLNHIFRGVASVIAPLLIVIGIAAPLVIERTLLLPGVIISLVAAFYVWQRRGVLKQNRVLELTVLTLCYTFFIYPFVFQGLGPGLESAWMTPKIVEQYHALRPDHAEARLAVHGYHEPSLVFMTATDTLLTGPQGVAREMIANEHCVGVVNRERDAEFHETMKAAGVEYRRAGGVSGFNYSKGRTISLDLYVR